MLEKKWTPIPADEAKVKELHEQLKVNPIVSQLLVQRGIHTFEEARAFFRPSPSHLHDPFLMKDMDKAVNRIIEAIDNDERILLYGDYDVDGTTCVTLMHTFLCRITGKEKIDYYIPDRYNEGYGVSNEGIDYAKSIGSTLIIAMDCGIQAIDKVDKAKSLGIDFIICDHHLPSSKLPNAIAVLDSKRKDCNYPFKELSGCGVTFKLAQGIAQAQGYTNDTWSDFFDLLVISIGCDIVRMTGENRTMAFFGLQQINEGKARQGLNALIKRSGKEFPVSIGDLVFGAGPMINAAGRLSDAKEAVKLLLSTNEEEVANLAESLHSKNLTRREQDRGITKEAAKLFESLENYKEKKSIVLFQEHWHKGVVGISASKIVEKYHRPTIILTFSNDLAVGSARSVPGFDIHHAIGECADLLENFGGHQFAAGLSLKKENLEAFCAKFEKAVAASIQEKELQPEIHISGELKFDDISDRFWNVIKQFAPFGPGNRRPVFMSKNIQDTGKSKIVKEEHLKLSVKQADSRTMDGIGFWMSDKYEQLQKGECDICYVLETNHWRGKTTLNINLKDLK